MKIIKGQRQELERELLNAMLIHGAEKRAARLKRRKAPLRSIHRAG